jgi:hypothetical protein
LSTWWKLTSNIQNECLPLVGWDKTVLKE